MSEVISYILGFLMGFIILSTSLYAFSLVSDNGRVLNGQAEMKNVANRVALGVQESLLIGTQRRDSGTDAASSLVRYARTIFLPLTIEGLTYRVTLGSSQVRVESFTTPIVAEVPTFNATAVLPPPGNPCTDLYAVCELSGIVEGGSGQLTITYEFVKSPITNRIRIL